MIGNSAYVLPQIGEIMFGKIDLMITVVFAAGLTWFCTKWVVNPLQPDVADSLMMAGTAVMYIFIIIELVSLIRQYRARRPQRQKVYYSDRDHDWKSNP